MRIVARPDFDGIVCAVLLYEALDINKPVLWVEPNAMQDGEVEIRKGDIIANLSYQKNCTLWFDHHESNRIDTPFYGVFKIAPSAAGNIFNFFNHFDSDKNPGYIAKAVKIFKRDYTELVKATDKIDSAQLTLEEVIHPEKYPYLAGSMTVVSYRRADEPYWNHMVKLLRKYNVQRVLEDPKVKKRCKAAVLENKKYEKYLKKHTVLNKHVSITDFRSFARMPFGNRYLVYALFPESVVNVKIRFHDERRDKVIVSVGHNIFNCGCNISAGLLCSRFGGGGHRGAGSCCFNVTKAREYLPAILEALLKNED
jgi:nanoRNase/pAp phosphatase (c-di-AMP/oligoRNAs hydrolase)